MIPDLIKEKLSIKTTKNDISTCKPIIYNLATDKEKLNELLSNNPNITVLDEINGQLEELVKSQNPRIKFTPDLLKEYIVNHLRDTPINEYGNWVHYPWSNQLVHLLNEEEFIEVRTNRNHYKITPKEEETLSTKKIGVIGLSVGKSIAVTIAMERICGELVLADFDVIELSNLNRIQTGVQNFGVKKTVVVAREIAEIDPYLKVTCYTEGITEENITDFLTKDKKLDVCIEVCDGLFTKILARQKAKALGVPVVMNSSDRGTTDVERYDLTPEIPILHGLIDHLDLSLVKQAKTNEEKVPYLLPMLGVETSSTRLKASMLEIEQTITTWPQLASSVVLGGGICTDVCRRILLGQFHDSGRYFLDVEDTIIDKDAPKKIDEKKLSIRNAITEDEMMKIINNHEAQQYDNQIELEESIVKKIVSAGTKAPSGANIQSWKFVYHNKNIYLFLNNNYTAGLLDCKGTTSFTGLGAAAENMILKAHEIGLEVITEELAMKENSQLASVFHFFDKETPEISNLIEPHVCDDLVDIIPHRLTNRNIVDRQPINRENLLKYQKLAQSIPGANMIVIDDNDTLDAIKEVTAKVDRMRVMHFGGHDDLIAEVRWNKEEVETTKNGVDILGTVDLTPTELAGWRVCKNWNVVNHLNEWGLGSGLEKIQRKNIASASAIGLITMPQFTQNDFYNGGRALERVWLAANKDNIAIHPSSLSTMIFNTLNHAEKHGFTDSMKEEAQQLRKEFVKLFSISEEIGEILLLRFFIADPPKERSIRYPLEQVLSFNP